MRLHKTGFTLIELVLVIAITGVLAIGVATITMNWKRSYVEVAGNKVKSDIEHARSLAMTKRGTVFGVFFNVATNQYTVYEGTSATPVLDPLNKNNNLVEAFSKWPGVVLSGGNYTVEFNSVGAPTVGGGGNISLTDGTVTKTIAVTANTGRVSVQ